MSGKTEALVRDLAALFVKYRLSDWTPILEELEHRGRSDGLADAIRRHAEEARSVAAAPARAKSKPASKRRSAKPRTTQLELEPRFSGPHAGTVEQLRQALVAKRSLPSLTSLKAVHAALGIKSAGASRREALVAILTEHLDRLDDEAFDGALRAVAREEERNAPDGVAHYDRWFQLITATRK